MRTQFIQNWGRDETVVRGEDQLSFYAPDITFLSEIVRVGHSAKIKFITGHSIKAITKRETIQKKEMKAQRLWALLGIRDGEGAAEFFLMPARSVQKLERSMRIWVAKNGRKRHPWSQNQPVQIEITREADRTWGFKFITMDDDEFRYNFRYLARIYRQHSFQEWLDAAISRSDRLDDNNDLHFNAPPMIIKNTKEVVVEENKKDTEQKADEEKTAIVSKPLPNDAAAALRQLGFITDKRPLDLVTELKKHCARPGSENGMPKMDIKPICVERKEEKPYGDYTSGTALDVIAYYRQWKWMKWPRETIERIFAAAGLPPDESMIEEEKQ